MTLTDAQVREVAGVARRTINAALAGYRAVIINGHEFDLVTSGLCWRYVRQVHEAALGLAPFRWPYARANANLGIAALDEAGLRMGAAPRSSDPLQPGDILGFRDDRHGHAAIYLGEGMCAENTTSTRGTPSRPGTKQTPYAQLMERVTGIYRMRLVAQPVPVAPPVHKPVVVQLTTGPVLTRRATHDGTEVWAPVRELLEALDLEVHAQHLQSQGKIYVAR